MQTLETYLYQTNEERTSSRAAHTNRRKKTIFWTHKSTFEERGITTPSSHEVKEESLVEEYIYYHFITKKVGHKAVTSRRIVDVAEDAHVISVFTKSILAHLHTINIVDLSQGPNIFQGAGQVCVPGIWKARKEDEDQ
ncbi:uncharacterized protein LOC107778495 isoform X1 [Nicotiana tabacum]|uniref:Uncharacterized protein LOC107778495 isoform X1 n=2 Tax=Nicotiana TaxID=4085 RepID=A0AC58UMC2_TOBAC|nr:PREDICTED: uncharacterized protein LOC104243370 isoform X2 [Nicotiana sylvestris]